MSLCKSRKSLVSSIENAMSLAEAESYTQVYWRRVDKMIEKTGLFSRIRYPLYALLEETIMSALAIDDAQVQVYIIMQVVFGMQERQIMANRDFGCTSSSSSCFGGTLFDVVKRCLLRLARGIKEKAYKIPETWLAKHVFDPILSTTCVQNFIGEGLGDWPQLVQDFKTEMKAQTQLVPKGLKAKISKKPPACSRTGVMKKQKKVKAN